MAGASLLFLAMLGGWAAYAGVARVITGATRVTFWGALAMAVTSAAGALFGATPSAPATVHAPAPQALSMMILAMEK